MDIYITIQTEIQRYAKALPGEGIDTWMDILSAKSGEYVGAKRSAERTKKARQLLELKERFYEQRFSAARFESVGVVSPASLDAIATFAPKDWSDVNVCKRFIQLAQIVRQEIAKHPLYQTGQAKEYVEYEVPVGLDF